MRLNFHDLLHVHQIMNPDKTKAYTVINDPLFQQVHTIEVSHIPNNWISATQDTSCASFKT